MKTIRKRLFLLMLFLSACSSSPPTPPVSEKVEAPASPTLVKAKIFVSKQVNPDVNNRASPVVVRLFELKSVGTFNESDFYGLFENYESVLGNDLLGSEQFQLNPGEKRIFKHKTAAGTQFIAVIAAYRDLDQAGWRDFIVLPAGKETQIMVVVDSLAISVWKK